MDNEYITTYDNEKRYLFSNWTNEDFTGVWGGAPTTVKQGETIELPMYKAYHFTKHLVNKEMMKDGKDGSMDSPEQRLPYETKTVMEITGGVDSPALSALKEKIKEELEVETGKKVAKITPKDAKTAKVQVKEFEDINESK